MPHVMQDCHNFCPHILEFRAVYIMGYMVFHGGVVIDVRLLDLCIFTKVLVLKFEEIALCRFSNWSARKAAGAPKAPKPGIEQK